MLDLAKVPLCAKNAPNTCIQIGLAFASEGIGPAGVLIQWKAYFFSGEHPHATVFEPEELLCCPGAPPLDRGGFGRWATYQYPAKAGKWWVIPAMVRYGERLVERCDNEGGR